uniref:Uncharacterized protein n=1 Tax=Arundo donax TaxID=35708 RepID=A0A0A9GIR2_ARUDO
MLLKLTCIQYLSTVATFRAATRIPLSTYSSNILHLIFLVGHLETFKKPSGQQSSNILKVTF